MWNSLQSIPVPYSSGAPSSRLLGADANSPSAWSSVGMTRRISAGESGDSVCMQHHQKIALMRLMVDSPPVHSQHLAKTRVHTALDHVVGGVPFAPLAPLSSQRTRRARPTARAYSGRASPSSASRGRTACARPSRRTPAKTAPIWSTIRHSSRGRPPLHRPPSP